MNLLDDGQVNHRLVEQLVANFAESHWAGDMSGALALKVRVEKVENAIAGEGNLLICFRQGALNGVQVVIHGGGNAIFDPWENRGVELDAFARFINALDADIDHGTAVVCYRGQARIDAIVSR